MYNLGRHASHKLQMVVSENKIKSFQREGYYWFRLNAHQVCMWGDFVFRGHLEKIVYKCLSQLA